MRKSTIFFGYIGCALLVTGLLLARGTGEVARALPLLERTAAYAGRLEITDLCLFSEARYTRHLSQTDLHTPFQEYPLSFEHFPTGSIVAPPPHLLKRSPL